MAWLPSPRLLWDLAKKVDSLLALEAKQSAAMSAMQAQLDELYQRMNHLEAREEIVLAKAEGASRAAAMASATAAVADIARRLGALEERGRLAGGGTHRLTET
jgi:hypothetical protein